jgi:hypothetical protein
MWHFDPAGWWQHKRTVDIREVNERSHVRLEHGLPVARAAQGPAAQRARCTTI